MAIANSFKGKVNVGSGHMFSVLDSESVPEFTKENMAAVISWLDETMKEDNRIGALKGGFRASVATESLNDQDDLGFYIINELTKETATASFSLFDFNAATLAEQYPTASYEEVTVEGKTWGLGAVGGLANNNSVAHVLVFMHHDADKGDTVYVMKGKNTNGFDVQFAGDGVQPFALNMNLEAMDDKGHFMFPINCAKGHTWSHV